MAGRIVAIVSAGGSGQGQTSLSVNLSYALSRLNRQLRVALLDMDPSEPEALTMLLGLESAPKSMLDLIPLLNHMDAATLPAILTHKDGVRLLDAGPQFRAEDLYKVFKVCREAFDFTVVNVEKAAGPARNTCLDVSDLALLVSQCDILSLHALTRELSSLRSMNYPPTLFQTVLCGVTADISRQQLARYLPGQIRYEIPEDASTLLQAALKGLPAVLAFPRSPYAKAVAKIASELLSGKDIYLEREFPHPSSQEAAVEEASPAPVVLPATKESAALKANIHEELVRRASERNIRLSDESGREQIKALVQELIERFCDGASGFSNRAARGQLLKEILDEALGFGPLEAFLRDPSVTEVMVNGPDRIYIEQGGKISLSSARFPSEKNLMTVIDRIVAPIGRRVDESSPLCDARLADGSRVNVAVPPLSLAGPVVTIRKFMEKRLGPDDLCHFGSATAQMMKFLEVCVKVRKNCVVSGGTGSGKTTLLNVLSGFIPPDERIVTVEDSAELRLQQEHWVRLESRPPNPEGKGEVPIRRLVINCLRMRPDRIVIGECRGGEALDMLQAMNTGHDGSLTTLHANNPRDALIRLETMVLMAGVELPVQAIREQIKSAIQIIVQISRLSDGSRRIISITEVTGMEGNVITTQEIFRFRQSGLALDGKVQGLFEPTGNIPTFLEEMRVKGFPFEKEMFARK